MCQNLGLGPKLFPSLQTSFFHRNRNQTFMPPIITPDVKGLSFKTMNEAVMAIRSQAAKDHVSYKVSDRNKTRAYLKCSGDDCPAYARISFHKKPNNIVSVRCKISIHAKDRLRNLGDPSESTHFCRAVSGTKTWCLHSVHYRSQSKGSSLC